MDWDFFSIVKSVTLLLSKIHELNPALTLCTESEGDNVLGSVRLSVQPLTAALLCRVQQKAIRVITSPRCLSVCL